MSIRYNNVKLASANTYHPDLFDVKWSDHTLDNISWLRADTFSWHYGELYTRAYQHLTKDITNKTLQSEIVAGITIQYYLADDGHKVCPDTEEENVQDLYEKTSVAWYYIIDTNNHRFKLPRAKHNKYANSLGVVGNGMALGTTDGTVLAGLGNSGNGVYFPSTLGYGENVGTGAGGTGQGGGKNIGITTDPEKSGMIVQQEQDTDQYKYLYFYVGNFAQKDITTTYGPEFMAHQAMPSDRYIDLTLGASESTYVAPADGYFAMFMDVNSNQNYIGLMIRKDDSLNIHDYLGTFASKYNDSGLIWCTCPVKKDDVVAIGYTGGTPSLRFVYAEGSK